MHSVLEEEYVSVAEAADLVHVSQSTIWRWVNHGVLPAYRLGPRRVWLRRSDLAQAIAPARPVYAKNAPSDGDIALASRPLNDEERRRMLDAVEGARQLRAEMLERRSGVFFEPSINTLDELRAQRTEERS